MKLVAVTLIAVVSASAVAEPTPAPPQPEPTLAPDGDKKLASTAVDARKDEESTDGRRYLLVAGETALLFGGGAAWYWLNSDLQKPDWDLGWDAKSWRMKLTSFDAIRFDTNPFHINMFGHTSQAVLAYHAGRGNGLGFTGASLLNIGYTFAWEYFVEYREYVSMNDLIVNSVSGPAIAEPLWQIGDYFRSGKKTWYNEGLAAFFQPLDEVERHVNGRKWKESARPWHRFELGGGTTIANNQTNANVDVDLEVASFDRSGVREGWTPAGGWSRVAGGVRFGGDGVAGGHLYSRTSYGGYQSRAIYDDGLGRSMFIGFGTGITYENSKLEMERDQFAAYHLIGPQADVHLRTRAVDVRWQSAAYGDLGMVHAMALGTMPPIDPIEPYESPLTRPDGYYFGVGTTGWTRLTVEWNRLRADFEAHGHQLWSIDKKQADRGEPEPPTNLSDRRLYGQVKVGVELYDDVSLDTVFDIAHRRGTIEGGASRSDTEERYGLLLTLKK